MPKSPARHKPGEQCPRCGTVHLTAKGGPACVGHSRTNPNQACRKSPKDWHDVCWTHGASTPQAQRAAARRKQRAEMEQLMTTLGDPIPGSDPAEVVAERIDIRRGHVHWLLARVRELEPDALTWGVTREKTGGDDRGTTEEAKPHIWYTLYVEAAEKLERLCIDAIRVGLEERRVRMGEKYADQMVTMLDGLVAALGHDPNDPATAEVVARHLELVA